MYIVSRSPHELDILEARSMKIWRRIMSLSLILKGKIDAVRSCRKVYANVGMNIVSNFLFLEFIRSNKNGDDEMKMKF